VLGIGTAVVGAGAILTSQADAAPLPADATLTEQFVLAANDSGLTEEVIQIVPFADAIRTGIEDGGLSDAAVDSAIVDGAGLAGGLTGAWAGAAAGAAIGSFVPIVGTAIGGAVGGLAGYIAGEMAGNYAGETLTAQFNENATGADAAPAHVVALSQPETVRYYASNFQLGG
jgi:hypothetical protein